MKVSELKGAELDYWVAMAAGLPVEILNPGKAQIVREPKLGGTWYKFSTDWAQSGPIIEQEGIELDRYIPEEDATPEWEAWCRHGHQRGKTPLLAAMRAYVASRFGEDVN